jgi:hypothetical protein
MLIYSPQTLHYFSLRNSLCTLTLSHVVTLQTKSYLITSIPSDDSTPDITPNMGCLKVVPGSHLHFVEGVGHGDVSDRMIRYVIVHFHVFMSSNRVE